MRDLFDGEQRPEWILLLIGNDHELRQQQEDVLAPHARELRDRDIVVVTVSPSQAAVLHGGCGCKATASDLADIYQLSLDRFSSTLIGRDDCVKWAAPTPVCFADLMTVIDEMPRRDAENATRGPASSF